MDRRNSVKSGGACNGGGKSLAPPPSPSSPVAAGSRASTASMAVASKEDGSSGDGERKALLPRQQSGGIARQPSGGIVKQPSGGIAGKDQRRSKRRVQWKDTHGKNLTEVLEFQPSDSSDSDDEYLDTCMCSVM